MAAPSTGALDTPHAIPLEVLVEKLRTDLAAGLDAGEAAARLVSHGPNQLETAQGPGLLRRVLAQLRDPLIYMLLAAGLVTLAFGGYVDAAVIGGGGPAQRTDRVCAGVSRCARARRTGPVGAGGSDGGSRRSRAAGSGRGTRAR
ncbi:cation-transporting P-type ATPase [Amycolatopsis sp. NPDC004368]